MKVLLVEDSRILRNRLRSMIVAIPAALLVAETDAEEDARSLMALHQPDVAVIDLRLKRGSGLSLLEHIVARYPATVAIVLTNYGQPEYRNKCLQLGAHHFFDKSRDIGAFEELLAGLGRIETKARADLH